MKKILVCPIAFDEKTKIKNVIERFLDAPIRDRADFLILDDGSTDGTTAMIAGYQSRGVQTVRHPIRRGVGAAIRTAIYHARQQGYDIIVIMAGNNKDEPREIPALVEPIVQGQADLVQGSRYIRGQRIGGDMPLYRRWATRLHPFLFSLFVGRSLTDSTNGFRAIRLSVFDDERIRLNQSWLDSYELEPYILFKVIRLGYRFQETAVTKIYPPKEKGYTKMRPLLGWWSILKPIFYLGLGIRK